MRADFGKIAAVLAALTTIGCNNVAPTSAAGAGAANGASTAATAPGGSSVSSSGTQQVAIKDPTLNDMPAFVITIPAKWHFQGTLYQGGNCAPYPSAVYRATSPDGLSYTESMPPLGWIWGTGPRVATNPKTDCLPMKGPVSAEDVLKYVAGMLKVEYVGPEAVPAEIVAKSQKAIREAAEKVAPQYAQMRIPPPKNSEELARAIVRSQNGSFAMKGRLTTKVDCTETVHPGMKSILRGMADVPPSTVDNCVAYLAYTSAPENQYARVILEWEAPGMGGRGGENEWFQAYVKRGNDRSNAMIDVGNKMAQQRAQQFAHDQAVRQQMHEEFLANMQASTDRSVARAQQSMNARSTIASDWVDYALDRQTVMDPNTGQISTASSSYSHTWVDSSGKNSYQTNDPNANLNGVLAGNWTQQQVVHGNGTPH